MTYIYSYCFIYIVNNLSNTTNKQPNKDLITKRPSINPTGKAGQYSLREVKAELLNNYAQLDTLKPLLKAYLLDSLACLISLFKRKDTPHKVRLDSAKFWIETYLKMEEQGKLDIETIGELRKWITLYTTQYQNKGKVLESKDIIDVKQ